MLGILTLGLDVPRGISHLLGGLLILVATWILAGLLRRAILKLGRHLDASRRAVVQLAATSAKVATLVIGVVTALGTMGLDVSAMVAGLGLTGFALGFAFRDILSNLLAGVLLLIYQPIRIGQEVRVAGSEGKVVEINLRYTVVEKGDETFHIPNSMLLNNVIRVAREA
jgi:small-conductance mechanosensitive channel